MIAVSLFNGKSGALMALKSAGVPVTAFYSSEIDRYANQATAAMFPEVIHLGDVTRWRKWSIDWSAVGLLIGGSPCQGFSFAGLRAGTSATLNGEEILVETREQYLSAKARGAVFKSQSHLFWEFVLVLDHARAANPGVKFLLENVRMAKPLLNMISKTIGVEAVLLSGATTGPQNRERYFWTNIELQTPPEESPLVLRDILEPHDEAGTKIRPCEPRTPDPGAKCQHVANATDVKGNDSIMRVYSADGKAPTLTTMGGGSREPKIAVNVANTLYRFYSMREMFRTQTVPEKYIDTLLTCGVSYTQLKKMCGNGFDHNTLTYILKGLL